MSLLPRSWASDYLHLGLFAAGARSRRAAVSGTKAGFPAGHGSTCPSVSLPRCLLPLVHVILPRHVRASRWSHRLRLGILAPVDRIAPDPTRPPLRLRSRRAAPARNPPAVAVAAGHSRRRTPRLTRLSPTHRAQRGSPTRIPTDRRAGLVTPPALSQDPALLTVDTVSNPLLCLGATAWPSSLERPPLASRQQRAVREATPVHN